MKRILTLLFLVICAAYVAWPGFSMYQIYHGVETGDEDVLQQKVDWPSVRASFKEAILPRVTEELEKRASKLAKGPQGEIAGQLGAAYAPQIVDILVDTYMTPKGFVKLRQSGGVIDMKAAIAELNVPGASGGSGGGFLSDLLRQAGKSFQGLPGSDTLRDLFGTEKNQNNKNASSPSFGLDNIKTFRFNSFSELELSVAKKPKARKPDLTAVMGFRDYDWKLVKLVPRL